jgi:hypothetical protein
MSLPQLAQHLRGVMNQENYSQRPVEDLNTVLGPLIGLPADSQIVEMESGAPTSFRDGMNYVLKAASENQIVRMSIETAEGRKRVMVFPGEQGGAARVMGTVSHQ